MARVSVENLSKHFGSVIAVDQMNLDIEDKEFLTLLGPSGCGKTTTLRLIAGLEKATTGNVYFDGESMGHLPANHRDIAMVFQTYALYPHMNAYANIAFALRMMHVPKGEIDQRVKWAAEMLGIRELLDRKPRELSGGERQRVALGRAIVREPAVFLLDEPLSNLDAKLRVNMRGELKRLHHELEGTFIYVTHDQAEALTMSDRIAIMNEGKLLQVGSPQEVYDKPANLFVAGFMGSPPMNFIRGRVAVANDQFVFQWGDVRYPLPPRVGAYLRQANVEPEIIFGVRPEAVQLKGEGGLEATVYVEEPLGADVFLTVEIGGQMLRIRTDPDFHAEIGDRVRIDFNPDRIHLFEIESGQALYQ